MTYNNFEMSLVVFMPNILQIMLLPTQILKTDFHIQKELALDHFSLVVALLIHMPFLLIMYRSC